MRHLILFLALVAAVPVAGADAVRLLDSDRCLRIDDERAALRCLLRQARLRAYTEDNLRDMRRRAAEHSTPEGRAAAVERLLEAHRQAHGRP